MDGERGPYKSLVLMKRNIICLVVLIVVVVVVVVVVIVVVGNINYTHRKLYQFSHILCCIREPTVPRTPPSLGSIKVREGFGTINPTS